MALEIIFATENSKFGYPEVKIGFVAAIVSAFLIRQIGERYEREHFDVPTDSQRFALFFEDAIHNLLGGEENDQQPSRMVIFIDDLDRCEDEHILRLLEALKLYLNSRYCVFVLGLDSAAVKRALKRSQLTCKVYILTLSYNL